MNNFGCLGRQLILSYYSRAKVVYSFGNTTLYSKYYYCIVLSNKVLARNVPFVLPYSQNKGKMTDYNLPDLTITKDVIERIQFSVASRNAEAKLSECAMHVFAAQYSDDPRAIQWQYVASGVACLLRNRELHKNGKKYMWSMSVCLYNVNYGVLVWKAKLLTTCDYTAVADNFHVFALGEVNVIVGLLFSSREQACELNTTYMTWNQERVRDDGKKGPGSVGGSAAAGSPSIRFRKEMISKPCNFQHIQGTQALDECLEIEKIKADILAAFFGLGTGVGRTETDSEPKKKSKKKKDATKSRPSFKEISVPTTLSKSPPLSPPLSPPISEAASSHHQDSYPTFEPQSTSPPLSPPNQDSVMAYQDTVTSNGGMDSISSPPPQQVAAYYYDQEQLPRQPSLSYEPPYEPQEYQQHQYVVEPVVAPDPPSNGYNDNIGYSVDNSQNSQGSQPGMIQMQTAGMGYENCDPNSQGSFSYDIPPPRLDLSLEKELADSILFQSPLMTAN